MGGKINRENERMLPYKLAVEILDYDFEREALIWLVNKGKRVRKGDAAGTELKGYLAVRVNGKRYLVHRIIWLLWTEEWPKEEIDHINGDKSDNWIGNLRVVSSSENLRNQPKRCDNKSGTTGVSWNKSLEKWKAHIKINGKQIHLGYYNNIEDAIAARKSAEILYGYHKNHGRDKT